MSRIESDLVIAATGTNTALQLQGKGTGKVALGDANLLVPDADGAAGQIVTTDGSANLVFAATPGSSGNVLTSNGSAWTSAAAAGGGAWTFLESITATQAASVEFTSVFDNTYKVYCLIASSVKSQTPYNPHLWVRTSTDGGSTWDSGASDYTWQVAGQSPSATTAGDASHDTSDAQIILDGDNTALGVHGYDADSSSMFELKISNPSGTSLTPTMMWTCAVWGFQATPGTFIGTGWRKSTAAIDSIQILMETSNIWGDFKLYGIADS